MLVARPSNHLSVLSGHFEATADSEIDVVRGNQYGLVTTGTFFQCAGVAGNKEIDFKVKLMTNTAITNTLEEGVLYSLTGVRMIALNNGSTPTITWTQESIMRIGKASDLGLDFSNRTGVVGLGVIVERKEIPSPHAGEDNQLEVILLHNDWDPVNLVKTHILYVLGREMSIVGHLVDWDIEAKMPVILVYLQKG
ncbi:hypothetical protein PTTG_04748 [Puccinia triticina 1-1 BBBD Race 1]|uniref:Uncharacterized protein n=1 Tax=Puccinia triticina (isolate 1-1 / race 1 (BBBD)) TaxID=630390 RepID=A0A180G7G1_PUCT1|nr:hypothetical protein PTTG_04748 [Puccinia triticina 1-1 BBBD Race 1]